MQRQSIKAGALLLAFLSPIAFAKPNLETDKDKISYTFGSNIGHQFVHQEIEVNPEVFYQGFTDQISGKPSAMTEEEKQAIFNKFQQAQMQKAQKKMAEVSEKNKKDSEHFLSNNQGKDGVLTLPSGLQYQVISQGKGTPPGPTDTVTVNYKGELIDGTEFDSSYKRNKPATFQVDGVIPGWTEALQLMTPGSKWKLFIPPHLGYGENGAGPVIGPNSALIFEVELLSVKSFEDNAS